MVNNLLTVAGMPTPPEAFNCFSFPEIFPIDLAIVVSPRT